MVNWFLPLGPPFFLFLSLDIDQSFSPLSPPIPPRRVVVTPSSSYVAQTFSPTFPAPPPPPWSVSPFVSAIWHDPSFSKDFLIFLSGHFSACSRDLVRVLIAFCLFLVSVFRTTYPSPADCLHRFFDAILGLSFFLIAFFSSVSWLVPPSTSPIGKFSRQWVFHLLCFSSPLFPFLPR